ncbi:hypothetical protein Enr13x_17620 [Stieleria neptunia]|uniref:Four helix bundle protein n=1 Tax=Stieleria neptunia TaxID=2527979 RepID=A0A518HM93_9BACT|nr:four helix bundle protein [Stieleria neptunia]QDV41919.1 hypothetical protein Enr13x_17620 [Stieleria neptunia]
MASYKRFEDLPVWNKAVDLAALVMEWTMRPEFRGKGDLANQIQRATLSISNNIAEGFERGTTAELLHFIYIAKGSAGEVRSMLAVMDRMNAFDDLRSEISNLKSDFENVSRQLRGWANSLQNSDIQGPRHLNDDSRERYERKKRQKAFQQQMDQYKKELEERLKREAAERQSKME